MAALAFLLYLPVALGRHSDQQRLRALRQRIVMGRGQLKSDVTPSVRMFGINLHYGCIKPKAGSFDAATVILSDGPQSTSAAGHVLTRHAATARKLLFGSAAGPGVAEPCSSSPVVLLDLEPLRLDTAGREKTWEALLDAESASRDQLGKVIGKPTVRAFNKLMLESTGATLVASGKLCPLVMKLLRTNDPHGAAAAKKIDRVVLLDPDLRAANVNSLLTGGPSAPSGRVIVDVAFSTAAVRDKRLPVLRAVLPRGCDMLLPATSAVDGLSKEPHGAELLAAIAATSVDGAEAEVPTPAFSEDELDGLGRRLYLSEIEVKMGPDKQYVISAEDITDDVLELNQTGSETSWEILNEAQRAGPDDNMVTVGALVLRGNRCILVRSLENPPLWRGMRLPAVGAAVDERPVDTARRAVAELCDVDCLDGDDDEFVHLTAVPPVPLYTPQGQGKASRVTLVHLFYAVNPPPPGPLEDADMEDDEDPYDWCDFCVAFRFHFCVRAVYFDHNMFPLKS